MFSGGFSVTGGIFDTLNNVECVFVQNPGGTYQVRVIASVLAASANPAVVGPWQDFALVVDNADVPGAAPVGVVPVLDRSGSMDFYGYAGITRTSSKQFVDELSIDDQLGVVSFGSDAQVEFPLGGALQTITGQPVKDAAAAEIDGMPFTGCTFMGAGIQAAGNLLAGGTGTRAIVLLSDGYDNKGCDAGNPALPWALDAAAALPADLPIFSCAMGPASDQALLSQLATMTDGRYYYMPTVDDLFEIYNYIRGQVSGDSLVANESATASSGATPAFVDAAAEAVTFTVAWADPKIHAVLTSPAQNEIGVRLRDPGGRPVPAHASYVRRQIGGGYVIFSMAEPAPGEWTIEVTTAGSTHVRYTAGAFVRSPLRLLLAHHPATVSVGTPLDLAAVLLDGQDAATLSRASASVSRPAAGLPQLIDMFRPRLDTIAVPALPGGDTLPDDIARLRLLQKRKPDLFEHVTARVKLGPTQNFPLDQAVLSRPGIHLAPGTPALTGSFADTTQPGGYNVTVRLSGVSPSSGTRFVRKEMMSVLVTDQP